MWAYDGAACRGYSFIEIVIGAVGGHRGIDGGQRLSERKVTEPNLSS